jgi:RES domain-containing protein
MILYRFSPERYSMDLSGEGAKRFGGRWNSKRIPVVYTSSQISLSLLELLIHSISYNEIINNRLTIIEVPDKSFTEIDVKSLKTGWQADDNYSKYIGDQFLSSLSHLLLKVPSAIIPVEFNFLINPNHKDFSKVKIYSADPFSFDIRLFKNEHVK